jgi:hypothetical protein
MKLSSQTLSLFIAIGLLAGGVFVALSQCSYAQSGVGQRSVQEVSPAICNPVRPRDRCVEVTTTGGTKFIALYGAFNLSSGANEAGCPYPHLHAPSENPRIFAVSDANGVNPYTDPDASGCGFGRFYILGTQPSTATTATNTPPTPVPAPAPTPTTFTPAPEPVAAPTTGTSSAPLVRPPRTFGPTSGITLQPGTTLIAPAPPTPTPLVPASPEASKPAAPEPVPAVTTEPPEAALIDPVSLAILKKLCPDWILFGDFPHTIQFLDDIRRLGERSFSPLSTYLPGSSLVSSLLNIPVALAQTLKSSNAVATLSITNGGADLIFELLASQQKSLNSRLRPLLKKSFSQTLQKTFGASAMVTSSVLERSLIVARAAPYKFNLPEPRVLQDDIYNVDDCKRTIGLPAIFRTKATGLTIRCTLKTPAADAPNQEVPLAYVYWSLKGNQLVANMTLPRIKAVKDNNSSGFTLAIDVKGAPLILNEKGEGFVVVQAFPAVAGHVPSLLNSVVGLLITHEKAGQLASIVAPMGMDFAFALHPRGLLKNFAPLQPVTLKGTVYAFE